MSARWPMERQQHYSEHNGGLVEVVPNTAPECVLPGPDQAPECVQPPPTPQYSETDLISDHSKNSSNLVESRTRPFWMRKTVIALFIISILVIIGLGVGLGLSLPRKNNKTQTKSADTSNADTSKTNTGGTESRDGQPSCSSGLCTSIISATVHNSTLHAFTRTVDGRITLHKHNGTSWDEEVKDLGKPNGNLSSQPTSYSWLADGEVPRLDVFVVTDKDDDSSIYSKRYIEAEGWGSWTRQGTNAGAQIGVCYVKMFKRLDLWGIKGDTGKMTHSWYEKVDPERNGTSDMKANLDRFEWGTLVSKVNDSNTELSPSKSAPAVLCGGDKMHELMWYDQNNGRALQSSFNDGKWSEPEQFEGKFSGDPAVFRLGKGKRWDFFGVQEDDKVYHMSYDPDDGGFTSLSSLGGSIRSVPTAVSVEESTIDIVALGSDGNLQHMHYDGTSWSSDWENLGVGAQSAPSMLIHHDHVIILAVTEQGDLVSVRRENKEGARNWKDGLTMENLGAGNSRMFWTQ